MWPVERPRLVWVLDAWGLGRHNADMTITHRQLGTSDLWVAPVALGCWPLAGITSGAMTDAAAVAVIDAALEAGVNHLDTAYAYGRHGESERRVAQAIRGRRERIVLATKVGVYWDDAGRLAAHRKSDVAATALRAMPATSGGRPSRFAVLARPRPAMRPLAETAGFFREMLAAGKTRAVGVSNLSVDLMEAFQAECPIVACQVRYNRLQREIEADVLPWCRQSAGERSRLRTAGHGFADG